MIKLQPFDKNTLTLIYREKMIKLETIVKKIIIEPIENNDINRTHGEK